MEASQDENMLVKLLGLIIVEQKVMRIGEQLELTFIVSQFLWGCSQKSFGVENFF
ncbi:MAG: hypothetical protein AAGJ08_17535 [Cyanobacteria bacterium P01_H01_bin.35]